MRAFRVVLRTVGVAALLALLVVVLVRPGQPLAPGTLAPPVQGARLLDGRLATLRFGDKPVVVNFWATWCPPCVAELPALDEVQRAWGDRVTVVGLATQSERVQVQAAVKRFALGYQIAEVDDRTTRSWRVSSLPSTFLVGTDGRVAWSTSGQVDRATLERELAKLPAASLVPPTGQAR
ncbi:MAG: TlpA family protein disulfide reductase [Deltaproteobacteria bacterium]|nr:TlpA family protein disulfide reductase [Deltaproteobacteria bacterium]